MFLNLVVEIQIILGCMPNRPILIAKRSGSDCIGQAASRNLFTGAIPLLPNAGPFACYVSILCQFDPP